jgi:phenylacetate-CoA ligase
MDAGEDIFANGNDAVAALRDKAERDLSRVLGVRARVEIVTSDSIPRTDFKARRIIDDRDLFKSLINGESGQ